MAYLAVSIDGEERIYSNKPIADGAGWWVCKGYLDQCVTLPPGSIAKLIGRELTWEELNKQMKAKDLEMEYKLKMQAYDEAKEKVKSMTNRELLEEIYVMLKTR